MYRKIFTNSIFFILLSSCSSEKATSSFLSTPTRTSLTTSPTFQPASTRQPVSTPNNEAKIMQATNQAFDELIFDFPSACKDFPSRDLLISPDGNWLAEECNYNLQIIDSDGSITTSVSHTELFGENQANLHPLRWTNDSQFLYFSAYQCCWDPLFQLLSDTILVFKLNISNGNYELVRTGLFDVTFSPTNQHIIFIEELETPVAVEIQDIHTEAYNNIVLEVGNTYNQAQVGIWSGDGSKFVVKAVSGINYGNITSDPDKFSLVLVDINNLSQKVIFKDFQTTTLKILDWTEDDTIIFQTGGGYIREPVLIWQYYLKTDILAIPTPDT